jgi:signal peptidase I
VEQKKAATVADVKSAPSPPPAKADPPRGFIAEWTVTIILLLFGTTTLVQAFVIPTGSMEDTLLIGDHLLVDKLAYAPRGPVTKHLLPYERCQARRHHRVPLSRGHQADFREALHGRAGRSHQAGQQAGLSQRQETGTSRTWYHKTEYIDSYRDNFPGEPNVPICPSPGRTMLEHQRGERRSGGAAGQLFRHGRQPRQSLDSRYWGFVPRENIIGKPLIIYWSYDAPTEALSNPTIGVDHLVDLMEHFFTKTRWRRTFMLVHGVTRRIDHVVAAPAPLRDER